MINVKMDYGRVTITIVISVLTFVRLVIDKTLV